MLESRVGRTPTARARFGRAGLSTVEVATLVSVVGTLLAVALPTLGRAVRPSKLTEASEQLEALYGAVAAYYATPRPAANGGSAHCLPAPAGPTPEMPSLSPSRTDFSAQSAQGASTWKDLGFTPSVPLRFRYSFVPAAWGCTQNVSEGRVLVLRAEGDLDGDGLYSSFERHARVLAAGKLQPDPVLHVQDRIE
jgi:type II secretory pathway pseudopilin PulG